MIPEPTTMERRSDTELEITRAFRAPAEVVFDAYTRAEHVRRWWAPRSRGVEMVECEVDLRTGGHYRYGLVHPRSGRIAFYGTFREVARPDRVVFTQVFEPVPGQPVPGEAVVTVTFEARDGETLVRCRELYPSKAVLDGVLRSGMESGMRESLEQLGALVATLAG